MSGHADSLDRWIVGQRPARHAVDPWRPYLFFAEDERSREGEVVAVNTVFLTNRECPWRCVMCDLWKNTLEETVPPVAIPAQIDYALARLPAARHIKLYNSGSFFDPRAIPPEDYAAIAARMAGFEHVIVESHPALVGERCVRLRDLLATAPSGPKGHPGSEGESEGGTEDASNGAATKGSGLAGRLEVAMGLETAHPGVLARLNKHMTLEQFRDAAGWLIARQIDVRVFILVKPPFLAEDETLEWAHRSLDFAFACGATAAALIPTRAGNGAMDALALQGDFAPPSLGTLEAALEYGLRLRLGRVFADLWDLPRFARCPACYEERAARLRRMNLEQIVPERVDCRECGGSR